MSTAQPTILIDVADITGELMEQLAARSGARIAHRHAGEALDAAVSRSGARVLIVGAPRDDLPPEYHRLLRNRAALKVVAVETQGRSAVIWRLTPSGRRLADVSVAALLAEACGAD
jgi:hypothetical protein